MIRNSLLTLNAGAAGYNVIEIHETTAGWRLVVIACLLLNVLALYRTWRYVR